MATRDAIPLAPSTGAFTGTCWVLPPSDPAATAEAINETMHSRAVGLIGDQLILLGTGLVLMDRQIVVTLVHGGQANLYVCDSMEVNQ